jgi:hypothetical protein
MIDAHGRWLFEILYVCFVSDVWQSMDKTRYIWNELVAHVFKHFPPEIRTTFVLHQLEQAICISDASKRWNYWIQFFQEIGWLGHVNISPWDVSTQSALFIPKLHEVSPRENLLQTTPVLCYTIYLEPLLEREALIKMKAEIDYIYQNPQTNEHRQWMDIREVFTFYLKHTPHSERLYQSVFMHGLAHVYAERTHHMYLETSTVAYGIYGLMLGIGIKWNQQCYIPVLQKEMRVDMGMGMNMNMSKPDCYELTCSSIRATLNAWNEDATMSEKKGLVPISIEDWYQQLFRFIMLLLTVLYPEVKDDVHLHHPWIKRTLQRCNQKNNETTMDIALETAYLFHLTRIVNNYMTRVISTLPWSNEWMEIWQEFQIWTTTHTLSFSMPSPESESEPQPFQRRHTYWKKWIPELKTAWIGRWFTSKTVPKAFENEEYKQLAFASWLVKEKDGLPIC